MAGKLGSGRELFFFHNTLACLVKSLQGHSTVIDLRDDCSVIGTIEAVDGFMNVSITDAVFCNARGDEYVFESFYVQARNIRYVHVPEQAVLQVNSIKIGRNLPRFDPGQAHRRMSRFSANKIMAGGDIFRFSDYDCIGFDLDSTLCHYNITNNVQLIYGIMSRFLVEKKGYDPTFLYKPIDNELDYLQKGLIIDLRKGNVLKLDDDGLINRVCHGSRMLGESEIKEIYGRNKEWEYATGYVKDMLDSWNGPRSENIRALLDYYDVSSSLCFSRCVETADANGPQKEYQIWPDILEGLIYMFSRDHYAIDKGEFFPALKTDPHLYYRRADASVIDFLKQLKENNKLLYVITGSNVDYANHTGTYCLGQNWNELFDVVIYYARKPGFFVGNRPFNSIKDFQEDKQLSASEIRIGNGIGYSQGNWNDFYTAMQRHLGIKKPRCLYIGDNLLQDIYTPTYLSKCDTVTINEEMTAEGMPGTPIRHPDATILTSETWGSYFSVQDIAGVKIPSLWGEIIRKHSKMCIPNLQAVAKYPIDYKYYTFSENKFCTEGFHPAPPINII